MKTNRLFVPLLLIFFIISINSIYSFSNFITNNPYDLVIRQTFFYLTGIVLIFIILKVKLNTIVKYSAIIYFINLFLLVLVLFVGTEVNGTRAWFSFPLVGTFKPSEFMKIGLILILAKIINNSNIKTTKDELLLILKTFFVTLLPSIVTFLEPDTGAVIIYFIILFVMLFTSKIRYRWFIIFSIILILFGSLFLYLYIYQRDLFISVLGTNMFYRLDRIFDWQNSSGMQLENSLVTIGSSNLIGNGINNVILYFPEGHTDFIFSSLAAIYGLLGMAVLLVSIVLFDLNILNTKPENRLFSYIVIGFAGALIYQQVQNISMTLGLLPITGITLPFISYGGSSLLSYMILLGMTISIKRNSL